MNRQQPQVSAAQLLDMIENYRIGAEYQPIKRSDTLETVAHEALARFYSADQGALPPQAVFDALHTSPLTLTQVELMSKRWQLQHAPAHGLLFLNLDPHAVSDITATAPQHPILDLLCDPARLVVELIENTNIQEAEHSMLLAQLLAARGIRTALDDIGGPDSMVALPMLCAVDIYKFDRQWLRVLDQPRLRHMLQLLLSFARAEGKQTILEGVETAADLARARELGVDMVQGYLFREEFINQRARGAQAAS